MTIEIPRFLKEAQADLLRESEPHRMDELDEDTLLELHTRVRRARSKYVKFYRQTGAERGGLKRDASSASKGKSRQAKKDSR